jgi:hypothetical protein
MACSLSMAETVSFNLEFNTRKSPANDGGHGPRMDMRQTVRQLEQKIKMETHVCMPWSLEHFVR